MNEQRPPDVMGSLPHTRPHRRSQKRDSTQRQASNGGEAETRAKAERPARATQKPPPAPRKPKAAPEKARPQRAGTATATTRRKSTRLRQPAQPEGTPPTPRSRRPLPATGTEIISTAAQAAAELAEIGISVSARVIRNAVNRLPRP